MSEEALAVARSVLGDAPAWLVGGALRDRLLGRPLDDLDIVLDGDVRAAAKALARAAGGPAFELSDDFGAWRVIGPGRAWQADLSALRGGTLEADLALRDFTINAMAEPLERRRGGRSVRRGRATSPRGRLRAVGPRRSPTTRCG